MQYICARTKNKIKMRKIYLITLLVFSVLCTAQTTIKDEVSVKDGDSIRTTKIRLGNDLVTVTSTPEWRFALVGGVPVASSSGVVLKITAVVDNIDYSNDVCEYYIQTQCNPAIDKCFYETIDNRTTLFHRRYNVDDPRYYYRITNVLPKRVVLLEWYADIPVDGNENDIKLKLDYYAEYLEKNNIEISPNYYAKAAPAKKK